MKKKSSSKILVVRQYRFFTLFIFLVFLLLTCLAPPASGVNVPFGSQSTVTTSADGKTLVGGEFTNIGGQYLKSIVKKLVRPDA